MVTCETVAEWEFASESARKVLADNPEKCLKLNAIHSNPSYYSGHILSEMEGLLGKQGDSHAEQNHSSIVAHLGKGGILNLAKQVCSHLNRHKSNTLRQQQVEWALTISASKYKSTYSSPRVKLMRTLGVLLFCLTKNLIPLMNLVRNRGTS